MDIKRIIKEEIELILESVSSEVFHFLSVNNLIKILEKNTFYLSSGLGTNADAMGSKKFFFLSLSRTKSPVHGYGNNKVGEYKEEFNTTARINFNGDKLNQNYGGVAFDYWQRKDPTNSVFIGSNPKEIKHRMMRDFEFEDRLVTDKPEITNINRYIKDISILVSPTNKFPEDLHEIIDLCNKLRIPLYFYDNINDFSYDRKNKAIDPQIILSKEKSGEEKYISYEKGINKHLLKNILCLVFFEKGYYENYENLTQKIKIEAPPILVKYLGISSEEAIKLIDEITYNIIDSMGYLFHGSRSDILHSMNADIHNMSKNNTNQYDRKMIAILTTELKKYKVTSILDLINLKVFDYRPPYWGKVNVNNYILLEKDYGWGRQEFPLTNDLHSGLYFTYQVGINKDDLNELYKFKTIGEALQFLLNKFIYPKVVDIINRASDGEISLEKRK